MSLLHILPLWKHHQYIPVIDIYSKKNLWLSFSASNLVQNDSTTIQNIFIIFLTVFIKAKTRLKLESTMAMRYNVEDFSPFLWLLDFYGFAAYGLLLRNDVGLFVFSSLVDIRWVLDRTFWLSVWCVLSSNYNLKLYKFDSLLCWSFYPCQLQALPYPKVCAIFQTF